MLTQEQVIGELQIALEDTKKSASYSSSQLTDLENEILFLQNSLAASSEEAAAAIESKELQVLFYSPIHTS